MKVFNFKGFLCVLLLLSFGSSGNPTLYSDSNTTEINYSRSSDYGSGGMGFKLVGQVGGPTQAVAAKGKYAYVGIGMRMVVLDVSKPSKIKQVGTTKVLDGFVTGVAVSKNRAYVTAGGAGLYVVSISNPRHPSVIGFYDSPGYPENVFVKGKYAYVADGWAGLQVVDISKPKSPKEVGSASTVGYAFDVVVARGIAYIAAAGAGLKVVDVKKAKKPVEIGKYNTPGYAYGLALSTKKKIIYVADGWEGLRAIDVSNPYQPQSIGSSKTPGWAFGVAVKSNTVYVADAFKGLSVIDVSSASSPKRLGAYEGDGHAGRVVIAGNKAYVADRDKGLRVIDISKKSNPTQVGFYTSLGYAVAVAVSGNYAYVAAATYGLRVVDISDPANPVEVGTYDTQGNAIGVAAAGNYAYVAVMGTEIGAGLHVVDVSNSAHPTRVGYSESVGMPRDITVANSIAYIANEWGLELIDVSLPHNPTLAGHISFMGKEFKSDSCTTGVDVSGTMAFLAGGGGLHVVDVSNPASPSLISNFKKYKWVKGIDVNVTRNRAYVTHHGGDSLKIIDVSDPLHPTQLGTYKGPSLPERLTVSNNLAYVAFGSSGVHAINITNPANPTLAFASNTPGYSFASAVMGKYVYVADSHGGLLILKNGKGQSEMDNPNWTTQTYAKARLNDVTSSQLLMPELRKKNSLIQLGSINTIVGKRKFSSHNSLSIQSTPIIHVGSKTLVVTSKADNGPGSLRECMENALSGDTITFDPAKFPPKSPATIVLQSSLPCISYGNITIDASDAGVILNGSDVSGSGISISSNYNVIKGLHILNFSFAGVHIFSGAKYNIIGGSRKRGKALVGEGNVISNNFLGVSICDTGTMNNVVIGNFIGTDVSATSALPNSWDGIDIYDGASYNRIGSQSPDERNIISGNKNVGVCISSYKTISMGNIIIGNFIGTDATGKVDLGNEKDGVLIELGGFNNVMKNNLISGNKQAGIRISDERSSYNIIIGNLIGTDARGKRALGNEGSGIAVGFGGANFNRIGGTFPEDRNIISGNRVGIELHGMEAYNLILGNFIGTDISGTEAISNTGQGIYVVDDSSYNFIGSTTDMGRNVISGNDGEGINVESAERIFILGNYIGTDVSGNPLLWNNGSGIDIGNNSKNNVIHRNLISGDIGIDLKGKKNVLNGNSFTKSNNALNIEGSNNEIYQNKFLSNVTQASDYGNNSWYRKNMGNYWSDYKGSDADGDGIGDTPHKILPNGVDYYPLMSQSNKLTVKINPKKSGKVTITPKKSRYNFGENVRLEANPNKGYAFSSWSGDVLPAQKKKNPLILTMNKDKSITANFISSSSPFISVSKRFLNFGAVVKGAKTPDQKFRILNISKEALDWQITDNAEWLECSPFSGSGNALINVSVNPSQLSFGTYTAIIYVFTSKSDLTNSFQAITVALEVISATEAGVPFGEWDKPLESASPLAGCLPFSGWALDRVGVESVKIYRLKVPADDPSSPDEIYVGDAFFVEGARPDVEAYCPHYPQCSTAGWGCNLVSEVLPGDGLYTFIVKARSVSGEEVELGRRKINIDNTSSFTPFGTLDFPKPGGAVSGSLYNVLGWALSKGQSHISEVDLYIDSEYKRTLSLGFPRPEIKFLIPGYADSGFPGFIATIDTTSLSNDYCTAFLIARDSEGRQAVLGSRYFYNTHEESDRELTDPVQNRIQDSMGVLKGEVYAREIEKRKLKKLEYTDDKVEIEVNELKNIAIKDFSEEDDHITYKVLYRGGEHLPLGISFDEKRGIISWLPIPGFKGEFPIEILKYKNSVLIERRRVIFLIE